MAVGATDAASYPYSAALEFWALSIEAADQAPPAVTEAHAADGKRVPFTFQVGKRSSLAP